MSSGAGEGFRVHLAWLVDSVRPNLVSTTSSIKRRQANNKEIKREACQRPSHNWRGDINISLPPLSSVRNTRVEKYLSLGPGVEDYGNTYSRISFLFTTLNTLSFKF